MVFGVVRRTWATNRIKRIYDDIDQKTFNKALPGDAPGRRHRQCALRVLKERRASPRLETPALTPAQQKLEELKAEIKARGGGPSAIDGWTAEFRGI